MFDIGWQELFIIAVVALVVVGPKELPRVLRAVTLGIRKIRSMASDFQNSIDELARESELQDIRRDLERAATIDFEKQIEDAVDPTGEVSRSVRELQGTVASTGEELGDPLIEAPKKDDGGDRDAAPDPDRSDSGGEGGVPRSGTGG